MKLLQFYSDSETEEESKEESTAATKKRKLDFGISSQPKKKQKLNNNRHHDSRGKSTDTSSNTTGSTTKDRVNSSCTSFISSTSDSLNCIKFVSKVNNNILLPQIKTSDRINCQNILKEIALNKNKNKNKNIETAKNDTKVKRKKKQKPLKSNIHTIHNTDNHVDNVNKMYGAIGNNNDVSIICNDVNEIQAPKSLRPHEQIINYSKECDDEQKQLIMHIFVLIMSYYGIKLSSQLINEYERLEEIIGSVVAKKVGTGKTLLPSDVRFIKEFIMDIMDTYNESKKICKEYIDKHNNVPFEDITDICDLMVAPEKQNSLTINGLFILCGFSTDVVNAACTISNSELAALEEEWDIQLNDMISTISSKERKRTRALMCGIARYVGNGVEFENFHL